MGVCKKCGKTIDDKYNYCIECSQENKKSSDAEILTALGRINNNLFCIIRLLEYQLEKKAVWNKEKKDFDIVPRME